MKWIAISKSNASVRQFNLVEGNLINAELRYNPLQQSIRLSSNDGQRVFFIKQAGLRNSNFVFKNEYGFNAGKIYAENSTGETGMIEYEETRIQYSLHHSLVSEMVIYEPDGLKPIAVCGLQQLPDEQKNVSLNNKELGYEKACLLWALNWYLINHAAKEIKADYEKGFSLA